MNAKTLEPLNALLTQTERERDAALAEHRRAEQASQAARAQSEQLLAYRREYEQRWQAQFRQQGSIELVHCYHGFMQRLSDAVDGQARAADQAASLVERASGTLRDNEVRCASVRRLIERRVRDVRVDIDRREQRSSDEQAARACWNRRSTDDRADET